MSNKTLAEQYHKCVDSQKLTEILYQALQASLGVKLKNTQIEALATSEEDILVEMPTGEGKTFVAGLWAAKKAKKHKVHVATCNDYLSERDFKTLKPFFDLLNISSSYLSDNTSKSNKKEIYRNRIVYAKVSTLIGDKLTDLTSTSRNDLLINDEVALVIDEADYTFIDASMHPFSIVTDLSPGKDYYYDLSLISKKFNDNDVFYNPQAASYFVTSSGYSKIESAGIEIERDLEYAYPLKNTLYAQYGLIEGRDFVVKTDAEHAKIVLLSNGLPDDNKKLSSGVMKALTYKMLDQHPSLKLPADLIIVNQLTLKTLINQYSTVFALTGPLSKLEITEIKEKYGLKYLSIKPSTPSRLQDEERYFSDNNAKIKEMKEYILETHKSGDPVLVITKSDSEAMSLQLNLTNEGVHSEVLLSTDKSERSSILERASNPGSIIIGNQAVGRGVDIRVNPDTGLKLHVISSSFPDTVRADLQARGRTARNGDLGVYVVFASLQDFYGDILKSAESLLKTSATNERLSSAIKSILYKGRKRNEETTSLSRELIGKLNGVVEPLYTYHMKMREGILSKIYYDLLREICYKVYGDALEISTFIPIKRKTIVKMLSGVFPGFVPSKKVGCSKVKYIELLTEKVINHVDERLKLLDIDNKTDIVKRFLLPVLDKHYSDFINDVNATIKDHQYFGYKLVNPDVELLDRCITSYQLCISKAYREMLGKALQIQIEEVSTENRLN